MSPESQEKLEKVMKYSASLRQLCRLLSVVLAMAGFVSLIMILTINDSQQVTRSIDFNGVIYAGAEITVLVRIVISFGLLLAVAIALKVLYHLARLFGHYANGEIFTSDSVKQIRETGKALFYVLFAWLYALIANFLLGTNAASISGTEVETATWELRLSGPFTLVIAGTIIVMVSWIMDVGRELREDQDLTV
jgi:hypothetical protein